MAKKYSCKNCGAELFFDPKSGKLHCDYCDSEYDPSEYDLKEEEASSKDRVILQSEGAHGHEAAKAEADSKATDDSISDEDLVVYQCPNCGAEIITADKTVATTCVYCNKAITLTQNAAGEFKPDYVLPFEIDRSKVEEAYRKLCKKSWLTPKLFLKHSTIEKIKGMYIPYWLFSFDGEADVRLHGENTKIYRMRDDEITEISMYEISEAGAASFIRIPADALVKMDNLLMDSIEPFDFSKMKPFNPAYLTGFYAQRWDDPSEANKERVMRRAKEAFMALIKQNAGVYTTKLVESEHYDWHRQKVEYVMLPVWMMYTEYHGKKYLFGMNGQNGKMLGTIPKDYGKLIRAGIFVFLLSQIILMIVRMMGVML